MKRTIVCLPILATLLTTGAWSQQATRPTEKAPSATLVESWSNIQNVDVVDPVYRMTAYSVGVPAGWKLEGGIVRARLSQWPCIS